MNAAPEAIRSEAAVWLLRRSEKRDWNTEDQAALDAWLGASVAHRIAYLRLDAAWKSADRLTALGALPLEEAGSRSRIRPWPLLLRVAAVLGIAAVLGVAVFRTVSPSPDRVFTTGIGGREVVTFADGSRIELNTDTVLRTRMTTAAREVWLDRGEAYFRIKHDAAHPFTVTAAGHRIVDLGTEFLVRRDSGQLEVALVTGRARVERHNMLFPSQSALLAPGDVVLATDDSMTLEKKSAGELSNALAWRHGMLVFHRAPLSEVAAEYNRYNHTQIVIADADVARRTISATLPTGDLAAFARMAENFFGLHIKQDKDQIIVSR